MQIIGGSDNMTNDIKEQWVYDDVAYTSKFDAFKAKTLKEYGFKIKLEGEGSKGNFSYTGGSTNHYVIRECLKRGSYDWDCGFLWVHTNQGQDYWKDKVKTPEKRRYLEWLLKNTPNKSS
jgi:hypothetical protein